MALLMNRSGFLKLLAGTAAATVLPDAVQAATEVSPPPTTKEDAAVDSTTKPGKGPNLLVILTDEQRFDQVGYASHGYFETPNLDGLAARGVRFQNAYSTCTVCVPARVSLMTGLFPHRFPGQDKMFNVPLKEGLWTLPRALGRAGYQTALIGKMHFNPINARHGFNTMRTAEHLHTYGPEYVDDYTKWLVWQGLADWKATQIFAKDPPPDQRQALNEVLHQKTAMLFPYDRKYHVTDWVTQETIKFLKSRDKSRPYCAFCSYPTPHTPYNPPAPYDRMYDPAREQLPRDGFEVNAGLPPTARKLLSEKRGFGYGSTAETGEDGLRLILAYIRGLVKQIDDGVGEILNHVNLEDTVVFFTTDHGDYTGHRGLIFKCPMIPLDDLARVPMVCAGAGVTRDKTVATLVQSFDIVPTCLDLAGVKPPDGGLDAKSLLPYLGGAAPEDPRTVYCSSQDEYPMVRRGPWKYFRHLPTGEEMLFDLSKDPGETANRIQDPSGAETATALRQDLEAILRPGTVRPVEFSS